MPVLESALLVQFRSSNCNMMCICASSSWFICPILVPSFDFFLQKTSQNTKICMVHKNSKKMSLDTHSLPLFHLVKMSWPLPPPLECHILFEWPLRDRAHSLQHRVVKSHWNNFFRNKHFFLTVWRDFADSNHSRSHAISVLSLRFKNKKFEFNFLPPLLFDVIE